MVILKRFHGDCACIICYNDNNGFTVYLYLYIAYDHTGCLRSVDLNEKSLSLSNLYIRLTIALVIICIDKTSLTK